VQLPYSNTQIAHWNPGAEMPLILPVHLICNTSDEVIYSNIRANSALPGKKWIKLEEAHDGIAVLCGSGPSLADTLDDIRALAAKGAKVFAMNGAAKFLADNGILPNYQVMIDARIETAELIGPAKEHLFASQVDPECFRRVPDARLWHLQVGNIENEFPEYSDDYCLIGGAASVGNTATCLAYAMGYRNLQIFGYDSSHRDGKGHAFRQPLNDGDPCASVRFNGKDYIASLTMKLQAEKFQETSKALKDMGCRIEVHGSGLLPDMFNAPPMEEKDKYEAMWGIPEYRVIAPGEDVADTFVRLADIKPSDCVIDFGCGTGRGARRINELTGCDMLLLDFTSNSVDPDIQGMDWYTFLQRDLTKPLDVHSKYGFCTDVMEHIPPERVDAVINNVMAAADQVFFQISLIDDLCGAMIGQPLHLSVHPHAWWLEKFASLGLKVTWSEELNIAALYYVSR
jgi:SAM-dependent methyltransferase